MYSVTPKAKERNLQDIPDRAAVEAAGLDLLDRHMAALNAYDAKAMAALMHFPHPRLAEGKVTIYDGPDSNPMDLFDRLKAQDNWHHSEWNERELIQFNADKAHWRLVYTRFRADGSVIGVYDSLYILTRLNGHWGIQSRSSFGP